MTVKTKLKFNVFIILAMVSAVAMAGAFGMLLVKDKISYLTEKSTPYQTKVMEMQRSIQGTITELVKISTSSNIQEYNAYFENTKKSLSEVQQNESELEKLSANNEHVFEELNNIADEMFKIVQNKIKAKEEADASYKIILGHLKNVSMQLKSVDAKIRTLQSNRSSSLMSSLDNTQKISSKLREVEAIKNLVKDIQMLTLDIKNAKDKKTILIARGKLNSILPKITENKYVKSTAGLSADFATLTDKIFDAIKLQTSLLASKNQDIQNNFDKQMGSVSEIVSSLALKIEQDVVSANSLFALESERQSTNSIQSSMAINSMADNAELGSLGLTIEGLTMKLFTTQKIEDIDAIENELNLLFSKVSNASNRLEKSLIKLSAKSEIQTLRGANGALILAKTLLVTNDSVISKLKNYLLMQQKAQEANEQLKTIVSSQANKTEKSVISAKGEQETAISKVNQIVKYSIIGIIIIGICAVVVSLIFGVMLTKLIGKSLESIQTGLTSFFSYISNEIAEPKLINLKSNDEFGTMAEQINQNIAKIENGLREDNIAIKNTIEVVNKVQNGYVKNNRISTKANNPQLNNLINLFNDLLNEVGKTLDEINESLIAYGDNNFAYTTNFNKDGDFGTTITKVKDLGLLLSKLMNTGMKNGIYLSNSSHAIKERVATISNAANQQAVSLEETAAAIEQLTSNVASNATKASQMSSIAKEAEDATQKGKHLADNTVLAISEISKATTAINDAISIIDQIAFQTNILSLNAAVEAATAGEAGKGFAVVAGEVRNLAAKSAEAAKQIKILAEQAKRKSEEGLTISNEMISGYVTLNEKIQKTTQLVQDVALANKEQMSGISQINDSVSQLDQMTQENAKVASESDEVANELLNMARIILDDAQDKNFIGKEKLLSSLI